MNRCPECGAESYPNHGRYSDFKCGSHHTYDGFRQTARCLISKLEAETAELRRYKAAWDWCEANNCFPIQQDYSQWVVLESVQNIKVTDTAIEAVECAMKQEANDAEKS